jgi:hypothetical protein
MLFPHTMVFALEGGRKAIPLIRDNAPVAYPKVRQLFLQLSGRFQVSLSPDERYDFAAVSMAGTEETNLAAVLPRIRPKFTHAKRYKAKKTYPRQTL